MAPNEDNVVAAKDLSTSIVLTALITKDHSEAFPIKSSTKTAKVLPSSSLTSRSFQSSQDQRISRVLTEDIQVSSK
jgi:hypothetical protein